MNRKQRRMAAKQGKQIPIPATQGATSVRIAQLLATGQRHHQAGQLAAAEGYYRKILAIDQNHADSLHLLGVIAHQVGRHDMAVDLIRKAIALNDRIPTFHNNIGLALDALGRTQEAVGHYRRAIALKPTYVEAHNNLGATLQTQSKLDEALVHYQRALALRPDFAEAQNNLGNALKEQGKLDEAVDRYQQALALKPNYAEAHYNLGNALQDQDRLDEALTQYQRALVCKPDYAEAHNNLGNVLKKQGQFDEAVVQYRRALALKPGLAEAHNNLGTALQDQGRLAEAIAQYRRALALNPGYAEAHGNLGKALTEGGDLTQALRALQRSIEIGESENAKVLFVQCVRSLNFIPHGVDLRENLIRALSEPWGRPIDLAKFVGNLVKLNGATSICISRATRAWPKRLPAQDLFSPSEFAEVCDDLLFRGLLESTPVCDIELERFLTAVRFTLLEAASARFDSHQVEESALGCFCALAQQCFINEYIFAYTDHEIEKAQRLRSLLVEALASGTSIPELWLVAVAAYVPLASLPLAELIPERPWSAPVAALVARQLREGQEERQLQASVPRLTPIEDGVSLLVKQQYEQSPYPRWMKAAPIAKVMTIDGYLRHQFPLSSLRNVANKIRVEILVAGCGTGQHSIETARQFIGAQILAVDLSLTSLCYAKRKTREFGLNNVEYVQADILQLESIGRAFDVIEASGVLHHLADPFAGWRLLLSMLRPGGFMRLGLYSKLARQDLVDVRRFIAQRGYRPSTEDIRRCRQELTSYGDGTPLKRATEWSDFFTTSTCRDLLFHIQEHQLTLPEINTFLSQNRLEFLGFNLPGHVLQNFRRRFPNDKTMTDLNHWHSFEIENPVIFAGMYQFWIQKNI